MTDDVAPDDIFYADRLVLNHNAASTGDRRLVLTSALTVHAEHDICAIFRHEKGGEWGWVMRPYVAR